MAEIVLKDVKLLFKGYDFSGNLNSATVSYSNELVDATVFGYDARRRKVGLTDVSITAAGWWDATSSDVSAPDPLIFNSIGTSDAQVVSVLPLGTGVNNVSYSAKVKTADYSHNGNVGAMYAFSFNANGDQSSLIRGVVTAAGTLSSDVGTTGIRSLGVVSSSQNLYLMTHVLSFSSSEVGVTIEVQADDSSGFATPTTQMSIAINESSDLNTAHWASTGSKSGTTGDGYFRCKFINTTTDDSFNGYVTMGVY